MNNFIGNCERCEKIGFDMCKCPSNNYELYLSNQTTFGPYKYLENAIEQGKICNVPFTVNLISPEMVVCYWQPGMDEVSYNKYYEDYIMDCQRSLQGVMG